MVPVLSSKLPVASLTGAELSTVSKLLLNAWSAEFALRIRPVNADRDFLNASLNWTFPQAYYAALFSARAVLAVDSINIANPQTLEKLLSEWAHGGLYGPNFTREANPFGDLIAYSFRGVNKNPRLSGPEAAAMHVKLTNKVHAVGLIHETYILGRLGAETYRSLIDGLPPYLKDCFVNARATFLLSDE